MKTPIPGLMNYTSWMGTKLSKDEDTHSWIDELHFMDGNKAVVLSGDWINVAIINANQYNIEQVVQTKFQDVGY